MAFLALIIGAYALAVIFLPPMRAPFVRDRLVMVPLAVYAHLAGGAIAMLVGPFQFSTRLRTTYLQVHRWMGRTYVTAVAVGGLGALVLAPISQLGLPTHMGFGLLAILWLATTGIAYRFARAGEAVNHRRWMIRSFSLTFAAVTLRIWLPATMAFGIPHDPAYITVSWLCWVPNLIVAEWLILPQPTQPRRTTSRTAIAA
jgi:uncharacterized membrane protein